MNKAELLSLLHDFTESQSIHKSRALTSCTTFLRQARASDICFYLLQNTPRAIAKLKERLAVSRVGLMVFNIHPSAQLNADYLVIKKGQWMEAQKKVCDALYPINWQGKKIIGLTGTNGKTTTVYLALQLLAQMNIRGFSIGSLGVCDVAGPLAENYGMTTPPYVELRKILAQYFTHYACCVMEVSSHALAQERVYKIRYDAAGMTSFSQDHLDYHGTLEEYFQQKLKLPLAHLKQRESFFIPWGKRGLAARLQDVPFQFSQKLETFEAEGPLGVAFNQENLILAATLVTHAWGRKVDFDFSGLKFPPGRFELFESQGKLAIVDSAHTPDAMERVLLAIGQSFPGRRIITVFGCGGNRDRKKRAVMGRVARQYSDVTIVTSDNPRDEDPEVIIDQVVSEMSPPYQRITNRSEAIARGVDLLTDQFLLAILGRGNECYQVVRGGAARVL